LCNPKYILYYIALFIAQKNSFFYVIADKFYLKPCKVWLYSMSVQENIFSSNDTYVNSTACLTVKHSAQFSLEKMLMFQICGIFVPNMSKLCNFTSKCIMLLLKQPLEISKTTTYCKKICYIFFQNKTLK
jgi:hypothetical protein